MRKKTTLASTCLCTKVVLGPEYCSTKTSWHKNFSAPKLLALKIDAKRSQHQNVLAPVLSSTSVKNLSSLCYIRSRRILNILFTLLTLTLIVARRIKNVRSASTITQKHYLLDTSFLQIKRFPSSSFYI